MPDQMEEFLNSAPEVIDPEVIIDATDVTKGVDTTVPPTDTAPVVDDTAAKMKAFETAMIHERRKRQELEMQLQAKQQEADVDRDEYAEGIIAKVRAEQQNNRIIDRIELSQELAREKYADYDEKEAAFIQMTEQNPLLIVEMRNSKNPAAFAYRTAQNQQKLAEMGNPDEYEKKLREKITKELEAKFATETKKRTELPGTLANQRGVSGMTAQTWAGPTELGDILK